MRQAGAKRAQDREQKKKTLHGSVSPKNSLKKCRPGELVRHAAEAGAGAVRQPAAAAPLTLLPTHSPFALSRLRNRADCVSFQA